MPMKISIAGTGKIAEEVMRMLRGELRNSLTELAAALAAQMLLMSGNDSIVDCRRKAEARQQKSPRRRKISIAHRRGSVV